MKKFKTKTKMIKYIQQQLNFEPKIALVVSNEYLDEILEARDFDCMEYIKETNDYSWIYLIDKYEDNEGFIHLFIEPVQFDEKDMIINEIENDFVIIQEGLLEDEDIEKVYVGEELTIVDFDIENEEELKQIEQDKKDMEILLHKYHNNCQECGCFDEEIPEEINDLIDETIDEINDGKCLKCALLELYEIAQRDGFNSLALGLSDMLLDIIEED